MASNGSRHTRPLQPNPPPRPHLTPAAYPALANHGVSCSPVGTGTAAGLVNDKGLLLADSPHTVVSAEFLNVMAMECAPTATNAISYLHALPTNGSVARVTGTVTPGTASI